MPIKLKLKSPKDFMNKPKLKKKPKDLSFHQAKTKTRQTKPIKELTPVPAPPPPAEPTSTPNGFDPLWIKAINEVLRDRETGLVIKDIKEELWDRHIGPMIDAVEEDEFQEYLVEVQS